MSYIDCFDHEYIGELASMPIYRPLQEIKGAGEEEFCATPHDLIVGETNAIIVRRIQSCVALFIESQLTDDHLDTFSESDRTYFIDLRYGVSDVPILEFPGWRVRDYWHLQESVKEVLNDADTVEDWICRSIGELVYFSMPELNPEHDRLQQLFQGITIEPIMRTVSCPPPGYPLRGGRTLQDGKVKWGLHRWQKLP